MIISDTDQCSECQITDAAESKRLSHSSKKMQTPVKDKACLKNTSHERLVMSLKEKRLEREGGRSESLNEKPQCSCCIKTLF